ncbi:hypothetical protein ORN12_02980 [Pantoea vagans]|uniref:hypothetical protein n=1 Tax=Pantoea vagans TaxID=470934 RepID=UPI002257DBA8|nr:hypothetical protein [Pantoea vagans]MCX3307975.1 hypothetical protein [Pantoea vagans]
MEIDDFDSLVKAAEALRTEAMASDKKADKAEVSALTSSQREGKTRSALTITFLVGFFSLMILCGLFVLLYNAFVVDWVIELKSKGIENPNDYLKPLELEKVLSVIIGALGTSLGFIIGYYFKDKSS